MPHRRLPEVLLVGLSGSVLVAVWSVVDRVPGHEPIPSAGDLASGLLGLTALGLLVVAWWRSAPLRRLHGLTAAVWSLPLLVIPPLLSLDGWAYAAQGSLLAHGLNPYEVPQGRAGALGAQVDGHWAATTAVYPPGSLWVQAAMTRLAGDHPYWSVVAMRLPAVVAVVLIGLAVTLVCRIGGADVDRGLWLAVSNPLVLVLLIGGMHNDGLEVALVMVALALAWWLARRDHPWWALVGGGIVVGLAGTVKQPGVLAGMGVVAVVVCEVTRSGRSITWGGLVGRLLVAAAPALAAFGAVSAIGGLGLGWLNDSAGSPAAVTSDSPIAMTVQVLTSLGVPTARTVGPAVKLSLALTALALLWCWWRWGPLPGRPGQPLVFQAAALAAFALCGAALQPWYLVGPVVVLAATGPHGRRCRALVLVSLACCLLSLLQWYVSPFLALPLVVASAALVWWLPSCRWLLEPPAPRSLAGSSMGHVRE